MGTAYLKFLPGTFVLLCLGACSTAHEFRVASVGDSEGLAIQGDGGIESTGAIIAASGNAVLGPALSGRAVAVGDQTRGLTIAQANRPITTISGQVTAATPSGTGVAVGDLASMDLSSGQVSVSGGPLSAVNVQIGGQGQLATLDVATALPVVANVNLPLAIANPLPAGPSILAPTLSTGLQPVTSLLGQSVKGVTGAVPVTVTLPKLGPVGCC